MSAISPSHHQLESLIVASALGCVYWDAAESAWVASPGLAKALGLVEAWQAWSEADWLKRTHPEDQPKCRTWLGAALDEAEIAPDDGNVRLQHVNGTWRWFRFEHVTATDLTLIKLTDITEARQDRAAMIDSQMQLRNLYELAPVAIIRWSREGRITDWNRMAETMFGHLREAAVGQKLAPLLLMPDEYERFSASISAAVKTGIVGQLVCRSLQANGEVITCDWRSVALRGPNGALVGLFSIAFDISATLAIEDALRRSKEQAEALSRAKTEFMALISHELRTPLNGVIGMAQVLEMTSNEAELEVAESIRTSGEKLLTILNEILEYTHIDARSLEVSQEAFSPEAALSYLAERYALTAQRKGLGFTVDIDEALKQTVVGDKRSFEKILMVLMDNAVKFTDRGEVIVRLSMVSQSASQCFVRCEITDTGLGVADSFLPELYVPFKQQEDFLVRRQGGIGLGLALAKKLVYRLNGTLTLLSTSPHGSQFELLVAFQSAS